MDELPAIAPFQRRVDELAAHMAAAAFYGNPRRAAEVTREHQKLTELIGYHELHGRMEREIEEAVAFGKDAATEPDLRELALAELPDLQRRRDALRQTVLLAISPASSSSSVASTRLLTVCCSGRLSSSATAAHVLLPGVAVLTIACMGAARGAAGTTPSASSMFAA